MKGGAVKKIKVALVDDHAVVRMGLRYALSLFKDIELVGELEDVEGAAALVRNTGADVTLLDISMPGKDGIAALGEILAADPAAKVVMLTTSSMEEDVYAALTAGAKGYVLKDRNPENIVKAVRAVAEGTVLSVFMDDLLGQTVTVEHAAGFVTHYANLAEEVSVAAGDHVAAGQTIGTVGKTALGEVGSAPHLHFAVYKNNVPQDPSAYLPN